MKRKNSIFSTIALFCAFLLMSSLPLPVAEAASFSVSKTNVTFENGKSTTITINASTHTGRLDIVSSNPNIAVVDESNLWVENNSKKITITAKSPGSAKITIKGELYDYATEEEKLYTETITVNVTKATSDSINSGANSSGTTNNNQTSNSEEIQQDIVSEEIVEPIVEEALPEENTIQEIDEINAEFQESASSTTQENKSSNGKILIIGAVTLVATLTIGIGIIASKKILRK